MKIFKKVSLLFLILWANLIFASDFPSLQTGDILLKFDIKEQRYCHCSFVLHINNENFVLDASPMTGVSMIPLQEDLSHKKNYELVFFVRPKKLFQIKENLLEEYSLKILKYFKKNMEGHGYNKNLILYSTDDMMRRSYYCSELVALLLNKFIFDKDKSIKAHPMSFAHKYFQKLKKVGWTFPEGKLGYGPKDFAPSERFVRL